MRSQDSGADVGGRPPSALAGTRLRKPAIDAPRVAAPPRSAIIDSVDSRPGRAASTRSRPPAKGGQKMARRKIARSLLVALALGLAVPVVGGCVVRARGAVVVDTPPPPPRRVHVDARPGFVWVEGYWVHSGGQWVWRDGYWERERPGYVYVQGRWTKRGG